MSLASVAHQIASLDARHAPSSVATPDGSPAVAAGGQEEVAERGRLAAILVRLLDGAGEAIHHDRDAAQGYIARASALLKAQRGQDNTSHEHAPVTLVRGGLAPWQIIRVRAYVEAHLDSTIRMRDLAAIARLSTSHFSRSFTCSFGVTPFAYVAGRRLARAQHLMLTTDDPLCQIALACGLCDQSHLTRMFRRHIGISPNTWRRRYRGEPVARLGVLPPCAVKQEDLTC